MNVPYYYKMYSIYQKFLFQLRVLLKTNKFQHTISYVADNHYLYIVKSIKNETIQTI